MRIKTLGQRHSEVIEETGYVELVEKTRRQVKALKRKIARRLKQGQFHSRLRAQGLDEKAVLSAPDVLRFLLGTEDAESWIWLMDALKKKARVEAELEEIWLGGLE